MSNNYKAELGVITSSLIDIDKMSSAVHSSLAGVGQGIAKGIDAINQSLQNTASSIAAVGNECYASLAGVANGIMAIGEGSKSALQSTGQGIVAVGTDCLTALDSVAQGIIDIGNGAKQGLVAIGEGIGSIGMEAMGALNNTATGIINVGGGINTALISAANGIIAVGDSIKTALETASSGIVSVGSSIMTVGSSVFDALQSVANGLISLGTGVQQMFKSSAAGLVTFAAALPVVGAAFMTLCTQIASIFDYLGQLVVFIAVLALLAYLGPQLEIAGIGLQAIALGMTMMGLAIPVLIEGISVLLGMLSNVEECLVGIIMLVLLAGSMYILAIAMQKINEQIVPLVSSLTALTQLFTVDFIIAFGVFTLLMFGLSLMLNKVASGMDKITQSIAKQSAKLAILNPLLATKAVLTNPIVGAITVAAAIASAVLVKSLVPAMATGGIVSSPTIALVGEGRYPEAVVPLGNSPEFVNMKTEIASAIVQALQNSNYGNSGGGDVVLNIDGREFARAQYGNMEYEARRRGAKW